MSYKINRKTRKKFKVDIHSQDQICTCDVQHPGEAHQNQYCKCRVSHPSGHVAKENEINEILRGTNPKEDKI